MEKRIIIVSSYEKTQNLIWDLTKNHFGTITDGVIPDTYRAIPLIQGKGGEILVIYDKILIPGNQYSSSERRILERVLETSNNNCDAEQIPHILFDDNNRSFFSPILESAGSKMREKIKYWDAF
jgi:hypothetical protein